MPAASTVALVGAGAAVAGGVIGGMADKTTVNKVNAGTAGANENAATAGIGQDYNTLRGYADAGPGASDISAGTSASRDLASMLDKYSKSGGVPGAEDITQSQNLAGGLFQGQRMALQQNFMDQETSARQNAAVMGRGLNDPVLRNKLAQEQTRQQMQLDANQGSLAQQLAMSLPGQRLNYAAKKTDVLQGLASQAMSNRQALLSMGEGIQGAERQFRLGTAERSSTQQGSLAQGIAGGLAGLGSAAKGMGAGGFGDMGGGGAGASGGFSLGAFSGAPAGGNIFGVSGNPLGGGAPVNPFGGGGRSSFAIPQGSAGPGAPQYLPRMN